MSDKIEGLAFEDFWGIREGFFRIRRPKGSYIHNTSPKKIERLGVVEKYYILNLDFQKIGPKAMTALSFLLSITFKNHFTTWTGITWTQLFKEWEDEVRIAQHSISNGCNIICLDKEFLTFDGFSYLAEGLIEAVQKGYLFVIPLPKERNDVIYFPNRFLIQTILDEDRDNRNRNLKIGE